MIKAIIFDFDGVLVLSEQARFQALQKSADTINVKIDSSLFPKIVGKTTKTFLNEVLSEKQRLYIPAIVDEQRHSYKNKIEQFVNPVGATINFIKDYNGSVLFAVASMSERNIIEKVLKHFGIYAKFSMIGSQEDATYHKPHPEIYLSVLGKLGVSAESCVAIEDTVIGLNAARAAGLGCYVLLNGINEKSQFLEKNVKGFISSKKDLEKIISG